jgi:hypothetical protein
MAAVTRSDRAITTGQRLPRVEGACRLRALDIYGAAVRCPRRCSHSVPLSTARAPLGPRRRVFQQPPGLDRRGPRPHLASIAKCADGHRRTRGLMRVHADRHRRYDLDAGARRGKLRPVTPTKCMIDPGVARKPTGRAFRPPERSRNLHRTRGGWARAGEFRCAEASVTVRATPAREAAPLIRSVLSRRIGGGRKGVKNDRRE